MQAKSRRTRTKLNAITRGVAAAILGLIATAGSATAGVDVVDAAAVYPEGPLWRGDHLLFVEYAGNDIKSWDGRHLSRYWSHDRCGPSALIPFGSGHLLIACYDANALVEIDDKAREVRTLSVDRDGRTFHGPNDFAADGHGGVYFSASGAYDVAAPITGTLLHLGRDGVVREVATTIHYPNGLTLSADGTTLLVAEMLAGRILAFEVHADGSLGERRVWARLQDLAPPTPHEDAYNGPDGLKLGPDGNYYIAQNGSARVLVVSAKRQLVRMISLPTPYVTNMAFGAGHTLFVTGAFEQWKPPYPGAVYRVTP